MTSRSLDPGDEFPDALVGEPVQDDLGLNYTAFEEEEGGDD